MGFISVAYAEIAQATGFPAEPGHVITIWLFEHPEVFGLLMTPFFVLAWYYVRKVNNQAEDIASLLAQCSVICDGIKNSNKRIGRLEDSMIQVKEHFADFKEEIEKCVKCNLSPMKTLEVEKKYAESGKTIPGA